MEGKRRKRRQRPWHKLDKANAEVNAFLKRISNMTLWEIQASPSFCGNTYQNAVNKLDKIIEQGVVNE